MLFFLVFVLLRNIFLNIILDVLLFKWTMKCSSSPDQMARREEVRLLLQCYSCCVWPDSAGWRIKVPLFFFFKYKTQINTTSATANDGVAEAFITHLKWLLKYDFYLFSQSGWSVIKILTLTLCSSHFSTMWSTSPPRTEIFESSSSKRPFLTWTVPRSFTFVPGGVLKLKNKIK